ncbi:hypothetical protein FNV43_RR12526 [Rhamnella rubrinervis]|uniref:Uncharacterized protein n=1 Tax=Rhamnella rubrinervis TaxID=2594499 RepID=A0A8K0H7W0_9ROSA|nr:hypothetical protein FNV43_RR12526 [Rhamnella rubrinervis]
MSASSGTSSLRYRKTVRSTSSNYVLGSSPGAGFVGGRPLPPYRSNKINDNAKETQFGVRSSIPHETRKARQQPTDTDSQQIELTSIRRFRPLYQPFPIDIVFPSVSSHIATKKSFQPLNFEALNHQYHPLKSAVFSSLSGPVTKAPSPQKSTVASASSNGPIATGLTKGDGSKAFTYQSGTSEMHMSNTHDWKSIVMEIKRSEHAVKEMNELVDIANLMLDIDSRRHAYNRRFEEFLDSYNSQLCPEKEDEICAMFDKEREDIEGRLAVLAERAALVCSGPQHETQYSVHSSIPHETQNTPDWKSIVMEIKRSERDVKEMKDLVDIADLMLDLDSRRQAYNRRFEEFIDSYNNSQLCPEKEDEICAMFDKEREDLEGRLAVLVKRAALVCSGPEHETQSSVHPSIPHETQNAPHIQQPQFHRASNVAVSNTVSKQMELTGIQRFQPHPGAPSFPFQAHPKAPCFRPVQESLSSQIPSKKSSQPITKGLSFQFDPLKSSVASIRLPATKAPSPNKRSVASFSSDAPTTTTNLSKGDGSDQSGTSKMYLSNNKDDWKSFRISIEMLSPDGLRSLKTPMEVNHARRRKMRSSQYFVYESKFGRVEQKC